MALPSQSEAVIAACCEGDARTLQSLLPGVSRTFLAQSALPAVARHGHLDALNVLLEWGIPDLDEVGYCAFERAVEARHEAVAIRLAGCLADSRLFDPEKKPVLLLGAAWFDLPNLAACTLPHQPIEVIHEAFVDAAQDGHLDTGIVLIDACDLSVLKPAVSDQAWPAIQRVLDYRELQGSTPTLMNPLKCKRL